jgi:hypothetical protein
MGLQVEFNYVLKLRPEQGFPSRLKVGLEGYGIKDGYRIYPINKPISLRDSSNKFWGFVVVNKLVQTGIKTFIYYKINRVRKMPLGIEDILDFESIDWE